jgi:hypothetical protein
MSKSSTRGGARPNSGPKLKNGEKKERYPIRLYPWQVVALQAEFGTVQKAIDSLTEKKRQSAH